MQRGKRFPQFNLLSKVFPFGILQSQKLSKKVDNLSSNLLESEMRVGIEKTR